MEKPHTIKSEQANKVNIGEANQAKKRKRASIWYNPPYSMNVKTKVKHFLNYFKSHSTNPPYVHHI